MADWRIRGDRRDNIDDPKAESNGLRADHVMTYNELCTREGRAKVEEWTTAVSSGWRSTASGGGLTRSGELFLGFRYMLSADSLFHLFPLYLELVRN